MILRLAWRSLWNRRASAGLTLGSIALSVALVLAVERVRHETRTGFAATVSGTDLVVGARASPVQLLLAAVFHVGQVTQNLGWQTYLDIARRPEVAWAVPVSLGDSYHGFRVVGTLPAYFQVYRYADAQPLVFTNGRPFANEHECVLGAEVARRLGARLGDPIVLAHGAGDIAFTEHASHPLKVAGVLRPTATPADRAVYVPLEALDAMHAALPAGGGDPLAEALQASQGAAPTTRAVTAIFLGLHDRAAALGLQRALNTSAAEPLTAILPAATLGELWDLLGIAEQALLAVSWLVVAAALGSMMVALFSSLSERRREMAVLRAAGARPGHVFGLLLGEALVLTGAGIALGIALLAAGLTLAGGWIAQRWGLHLGTTGPTAQELAWIATVALSGLCAGGIPAYRMYRMSLSDGLTVRL